MQSYLFALEKKKKNKKDGAQNIRSKTLFRQVSEKPSVD